MGLFDGFDADFASSIPPNAIQCEMSVLGALLANNRWMELCVDLKPEDFVGEKHGDLFEAISQAIAENKRADGATMAPVFGSAMLSHLLASIIDAPRTIPPYVAMIRNCAYLRKCQDIARAFNHDSSNAASAWDAIAAQYMQRIEELMTGQASGDDVPLSDAMEAAVAAMERARTGITAGISTGFKSVDDRIGGLEPGLVYVFGGRPGSGKSAFGHQISLNVARAGVPVLELSLEMSSTALGRRTLSSAAGVDIRRIKTGSIGVEEADRIVRAQRELRELPLVINDTTGLTPQQISMKVRAAKRKYKIGLVMIDHLNLMKADDIDARHGGTWATERAADTVLQIAKDCEIPVMLLVQLNRNVEHREDKRPTLSDLRQAGKIEENADAVGLLYRPEYYFHSPPEQKPGELNHVQAARLSEWQEHYERIRGKAELIWGKVRDGEPGTDHLTFHAPTATFGEQV